MSFLDNPCSHENFITVNDIDEEKQSYYCGICQEITSEGLNQNLSKVISYYKKNKHSEFIDPLLLYEKMRKNDIIVTFPYKSNYGINRKDAVDFVGKLTSKYKISQDSFYLAILYMDILGSNLMNIHHNIDLLAIGCFFLAAKFIENDAYLGSFSKLISNLHLNIYSIKEMREIEIICVKNLEYNLSRNTAKQYYDLICQVGFIFTDEIQYIENEDFNQLYSLGYDILKEFILNNDSLYFSSIEIAFSIMIFLRDYSINLFSNQSCKREIQKNFSETKNPLDKNTNFNSNNLLKFLNLKNHRKRLFLKFYSMNERSYLKCYEKIKNIRKVEELNYNSVEAYLCISPKITVKKQINTIQHSSDVKKYNLHTPEKSLNKNSKTNSTLAYSNNCRNSSYNKFSNNVNNFYSNNKLQSYRIEENTPNEKKIIKNSASTSNFLKKLENLNFNSEKAKNSVINLNSNTKQITNREFHYDEVKDTENVYEKKEFKDEDYLLRNLIENGKNIIKQIPSKQQKFKSNTSKKLININVFQSIKEKLAKNLNENNRNERNKKINFVNYQINEMNTNNTFINKEDDISTNNKPYICKSIHKGVSENRTNCSNIIQKLKEKNKLRSTEKIEFIHESEDIEYQNCNNNIETDNFYSMNTQNHDEEVKEDFKAKLLNINNKILLKNAEAKVFSTNLKRTIDNIEKKQTTKSVDNQRIIDKIKKKIDSKKINFDNSINNMININLINQVVNSRKNSDFNSKKKIGNVNGFLKKKENKNMNHFGNKANTQRNNFSSKSKFNSNNDNSDNSTNNNSSKENNSEKNAKFSAISNNTNFINLKSDKISSKKVRKFSEILTDQENLNKKISIVSLNKFKEYLCKK